MKQLDPVLALLFAGIVFSAIALAVIDWFFKGEGQVFQVIAGLLMSFNGAFFLRIMPDKHDPPPPPSVVTQ